MNPALLPIFLIVVVDILGLTIILPLLPFYSEHFGASPFVYGTLAATFSACQLIAGPILGKLSDRFGRRPLLLISQLGTLIGFLILAFASSLSMIFLSRVIDGLTAGNLSLAQAYISDVTEPKDRAKSFAIIGIAFGLGFLIGPALSGFLSQYGYKWPILVAAGLSATSILATYFLLPEGTHKLGIPEKSETAGPAAPGGKRLGLLSWGEYARYFRDPKLSRFLIQFFLFCFGFALFTGGFALFAERRFVHDGLPFGPKQVGYLFAYSGLLGVIFQGGLIGRLVARFGERALVRAGFVSMAIGYGLLAFSYNIPILLVASTFASFGTGTLRPALTSLISQSVGRKEQGVVLGLNQSLNSIAQIIAPPLAGLLIAQGFLSLWACLAGLVAALGVLLSLTA